MCYQYDQAAGKIAAGTNKGSKTRADRSSNSDTLELLFKPGTSGYLKDSIDFT